MGQKAALTRGGKVLSGNGKVVSTEDKSTSNKEETTGYVKAQTKEGTKDVDMIVVNTINTLKAGRMSYKTAASIITGRIRVRFVNAIRRNKENSEFGYEIVENISYSAQATNVTSEVLRLKEADADVVMMSSYAADALLFMAAFKEQNYFPKMLFGQRGGFMASDFAMNLGDDSDYVLTTARWNSDMENEASQTISQLFYDETGITLIGDTLVAVWDGILLTGDDQRPFNFNGEPMISSASREVDYQGKEVEMSIYLNGISDYVKGIYTVEAYTENNLLGSAELMLR